MSPHVHCFMMESAEDDETEWEEEIENEPALNDVDLLPELGSNSTDRSDIKSLEILVPKGQSKKKRNFYNKAVEAHEKEQRKQVHKVHLLCLLAHAMINNELCNNQLIQSLMVSMVPKSLALVDYTILGKDMLSRLLKWYSPIANTLLGVLNEYSDELDDKVTLSYDVLMFVSILRGLGIRTRIVLSFKVVPYKLLSKTSKNKKLVSASEQSNVSQSEEKCMEDVADDTPTPSLVCKTEHLTKKHHKSSVSQTRSPYFSKKRSSSGKKRSSSSPDGSIESCDFTPNPKRPKLSDSLDSSEAATPDPSDSKDYQLLYDGYVSDITARYASQWCTTGLKNRIDQKWWAEVLRPYAPPTSECELEEKDIFGILVSRPLPTLLSEYKGHPLYVLRQHLSKFEVIYPEDSEILGHFKNEPLYSRSSLHTREKWLKEARLVRRNEKPVKVVKGRKRKGQSSTEAEDNKAELFGLWQTEEYIPPPVVDGKITRNEFGNIELFKPSMLPVGAVHLNVSGIAKVARKLDIDYAPAMMGWNHCGRQCHPIIEGIVVAEEYRNTLMEAWSQEQQLLVEKDIKKRSKRATDRWLKLTKGLIIRERVKKKFSLAESLKD